MKVLRSTLIHPKNGATGALHGLLDELDGYLSKQPGFVESYELETTGSLGRISIWESREAADHAATQPHTIAVRSRIHRFSQPDLREQILTVTGERHAA